MVNIGITGVQVIVDDILRIANYTGNNVSMQQVGLAANEGVDHFFRLAVSCLFPLYSAYLLLDGYFRS